MHSNFDIAKNDVNTLIRRGWPAPGTPYHYLIQAETTADRLTHIGRLPGLLRHMGAVAAMQKIMETPSRIARQRNQLHMGRKALVAARLADPTQQLTVEAILDTTAFDEVVALTPPYAHAQAAEILTAMDAGWNVRIGEGILEPLPPQTYDIITTGNPQAPTAVYWESDNELHVPHDTWQDTTEARDEAAKIYERVQALALSAQETRKFFEGYC